MQNYYIIYFDESGLIKIIIKIMGNEISFFKHFTNVTSRFNDVEMLAIYQFYRFATVNTVKESALPRALKFLTQ